MDIRIGAVQEGDVAFSATGHNHSGGANGSTIGLDALRVDEQSAENAGAVTLSAADTLIAELASMTVAAGDRILCVAYARANMIASAQIIQLAIVKSAGTATITFANDLSEIRLGSATIASETHRGVLSAIGRITVSGTITLRLVGQALNPTDGGTVPIGEGQLHAIVLRGTG